MGTDGACSLLFCAAKRSGVFHPSIPTGTPARIRVFNNSDKYDAEDIVL
jgi:hypothetical protein